jgi:hypothetical protein
MYLSSSLLRVLHQPLNALEAFAVDHSSAIYRGDITFRRWRQNGPESQLARAFSENSKEVIELVAMHDQSFNANAILTGILAAIKSEADWQDPKAARRTTLLAARRAPIC